MASVSIHTTVDVDSRTQIDVSRTGTKLVEELLRELSAHLDGQPSTLGAVLVEMAGRLVDSGSDKDSRLHQSVINICGRL